MLLFKVYYFVILKINFILKTKKKENVMQYTGVDFMVRSKELGMLGSSLWQWLPRLGAPGGGRHWSPLEAPSRLCVLGPFYSSRATAREASSSPRVSHPRLFG